MPRAAAAKTAKEMPKKAPAKKRAPRAHKMPDPLPPGEILKDLHKKEWKLGGALGKGGFGVLYLADKATASPVGADAKFVVKVEPKDNGPLFTELAFYQRVAKAEMVDAWKTNRKLGHLGVPKFIGAGMHVKGKTELRFLIMDRFGDDIWKKYLASNKRFTPKVAFTLGLQILDSLEYLHSNGYAHADIKSANILLGYGPKAQNQVYLVDYGLVNRFSPNGEHKEYKADPKKAHDGTPEFTSIDAHSGVAPSRRGDLEILGYVIVQWLAGLLPWEDKISESHTDFPYVMSQKKEYMSNIGSLMKTCFPHGDHPAELLKYLTYVSKLGYEDVPDYKKLKELFTKAITGSGCRADGKLDFSIPSSSPTGDSDVKGQAKKRKPDNSNADQSPKKVKRNHGLRKPVLSSSPNSASGDLNPQPPRKGRRPNTAKMSPKPKTAARVKETVRRSARSSLSTDDSSSPSPVKKAPKTAAVKKSPGRPRVLKAPRSATPQTQMGEVFTRRKRKTPVAVATSSTQTSPGIKQTPKIKRKR